MGGNVGGLLEAMLHPVGNFGKFLTVLLSLSVAPNIAASFYSVSLNMQVVIPILVVVPRYVFSIVVTAMYVYFPTNFLLPIELPSLAPASFLFPLSVHTDSTKHLPISSVLSAIGRPVTLPLSPWSIFFSERTTLTTIRWEYGINHPSFLRESLHWLLVLLRLDW